MAHREPELDPTTQTAEGFAPGVVVPLSRALARGLAGLLLTLDIFSTGLLLIEYEYEYEYAQTG